MTEKYLLLYRKIESADWQITPFSEGVTVGSAPHNQLSIDDGELSQVHFELRENPTGIFLKDVDAESGETLLFGEPLPAHRPTPLMINQPFTAGNYEFKVEVNTDHLDEGSPFKQVLQSVKEFGAWKGIIIAATATVIAFLAALLIYRSFIQKPEEIGELTATAEIEEAVETVGALVPTELFELSSTVVVDAVDGVVAAPGMGEFELEEFFLDISEMDVNDLLQFSADPDSLISMATTIVGENVGFVYSFSGVNQEGRIIATGMEYVNAPSDEEVDGVEIPEWDESEIPIELLWKPVIHYIEDGENKATAFLQPSIYGAETGNQVYWVEGVYQQQSSSEEYTALARFSEAGDLLDILTFGVIGSERQTPYKVNYRTGDRFMPYEQEFVHDSEKTEQMALELTGGDLPSGWATLLQMAIGDNADGSFQFGIGEFTRHPGTSLTIGENGLWWTTEINPVGDFVAGVIVEDLDSNLWVGYIPILVNP